MQTLYIDVYFLINFTVDLISLHFASLFSKVPTGMLRLVFSSLILSLLSCIFVLLDGALVTNVVLYSAMVLVLTIIFPSAVSLIRRIKLAVLCFVLMLLSGGIVYFLFNALKEVLPQQAFSADVNRKALVIAIVILICLGIIKMLLALFSNTQSERSAKIKLELMGRTIEICALVDSGNLLKDPIDSTPVMLVKKEAALSILPDGIPDFNSCSGTDIGKRVRLIPVNRNGVSEILVGIRPERAVLLLGAGEEEIKINFVIDKEGGTFGGYEGLLPASVFDNL